MTPTLFRLDTRRLTWRECWWQSRSPTFLILAVCKLLRIRLPLPMVLPYLSRLADFAVPMDQVPPDVLAKLEPALSELAACGFHSPVFYRYAASRGQTVTHLVTLLHRSGESIARVFQTVNLAVHPPQEKLRLAFLTQLRDGLTLLGVASRQEFETLPGVTVVRQVNASPSELWTAFSAELARHRSGNPPPPITDVTAAETLAESYEHAAQQFNLQRGLYVPLTETEVAAEQVGAASEREAADTVGAENAAVLTEIEKVLTEKPKWSSGLWILVLSLIAFLAAGTAQWDFEFVLLLVPVLLLHETGHWLAMRLFGYRNLRMFFIPFFGAAVTGRHFNVAGWKKALVSLAGPAPGMLLATALAFAGIWFDLPGLEKAVVVTLILNGINLLPFVPLDGGWYLNSVLFCRHAVLEVGFKLFAVLGLLFASVRTDDRIWMFLGIMMAISLPNTWRLSRLAGRLRREGVPAMSLDQQNIPTSTAVRLIEAVRGSTKQTRNTRGVANEVLDVFERMNARPPGIGATLALLAAYVGVLVVGFVGLGAHTLAGGGALAALAAAAGEFKPEPLNPARSLTCGDIAVSRRLESVVAYTNQVRLVASFPDVAAADATFAEWRGNAVRAARVGSTVVGLFTAGDARVEPIAAALKPLGTNRLVWTAQSNSEVWVNLTCHLPDALTATNLFQELDEYFQAGVIGAVAPWMTNRPLTVEQRNARHTFRRLAGLELEIAKDKELRKAQRKFFRTFTRGDTNSMARASSKLDEVRHRLLTQAEDRLLASGDPRLVAAVVQSAQAERALLEDQRDYRKSSAERARLVGSVPRDETGSELSDRGYGVSGSVDTLGEVVTLRGLSFEELELGLPALLGWLCGHDGAELRFEVIAAGGEADADEP